ncbi:unnamed protein product [Phytomonas sp. Hart1]|nr:unnamed protein product [Phytomonas sp. Hart1]|eukprot:CCW71116.1 unnamed protein product [Phytomonas sp. isolate Hart1]
MSMLLDRAPRLTKPNLAKNVSDGCALDIHESVVLIKQIPNLITSAAVESPPSGVSTAEVQRRVAMLHSVLEPMKNHVESMRFARKLKEYKHLVRIHTQRLKAEEEAKKRNAEEERSRNEQERNLNESKVLYYQGLNDVFSQKIFQCKARNHEAMLNIIAKGKEAEENRALKLEKHMRDREMKQLALQKRQNANMERVRSVNSRYHNENTLNQLRKQQEAEIRALEVKMRLDFVRKYRILSIAAKNSNRYNSKTLTELERTGSGSNSKSYEKLMEELETKHKQQQERYAEQKAAQQEYQNVHTLQVANRRLQQKNNALSLVEEKIAHDEKIIENLNEKMSKIKKTKKAQDLKRNESRLNTIADIEMHKIRAEQIESKRQIEFSIKSFQRWNARVNSMLGRIQGVHNTNKNLDDE